MKLSILPGEYPLPESPSVELNNGKPCIPQQFFRFSHTLSTVEHILFQITYDTDYLIFVAEDENGLFLQVGIVGIDNYLAEQRQDNKKIVFGRKWRVEPELPSSEIIQTAFLALQKAREHEIRELFKFKWQQHITTPFNNHLDLPLMANNQELFSTNTQTAPFDLDSVNQALENIRYDKASFHCQSITSLASKDCQQVLLALTIVPHSKTRLPEIEAKLFHLVLDAGNIELLYYQLMDYLVSLSNQHVEQHFKFNGFARFDRNATLSALADFSVSTRVMSQAGHAQIKFKQMNYAVDKNRVPQISHTPYSQKLKHRLAKFGPLTGISPFDAEQANQ